MRDHQAILEEELRDDELSRRAHAEQDQRSWLREQITDMASVFAPYLGFANIRLSVIPSLKLFAQINDSRRLHFCG